MDELLQQLAKKSRLHGVTGFVIARAIDVAWRDLEPESRSERHGVGWFIVVVEDRLSRLKATGRIAREPEVSISQLRNRVLAERMHAQHASSQEYAGSPESRPLKAGHIGAVAAAAAIALKLDRANDRTILADGVVGKSIRPARDHTGVAAWATG